MVFLKLWIIMQTPLSITIYSHIHFVLGGSDVLQKVVIFWFRELFRVDTLRLRDFVCSSGSGCSTGKCRNQKITSQLKSWMKL